MHPHSRAPFLSFQFDLSAHIDTDTFCPLVRINGSPRKRCRVCIRCYFFRSAFSSCPHHAGLIRWFGCRVVHWFGCSLSSLFFLMSSACHVEICFCRFSQTTTKGNAFLLTLERVSTKHQKASHTAGYLSKDTKKKREYNWICNRCVAEKMWARFPIAETVSRIHRLRKKLFEEGLLWVLASAQDWCDPLHYFLFVHLALRLLVYSPL